MAIREGAGLGAIAGARSPAQVDGWLPAATRELGEDDLAEIAAAIKAAGGGCGGCGGCAGGGGGRGGCGCGGLRGR